LICIYLRRLYGGMKGDLKMLNESIQYYKKNENLIKTTKFDENLNIEKYNYNLANNLITEAIDFHPFPKMVKEIKIEAGIEITEEEIKSLIWRIQSATNFRKPYILSNSQVALQDPKWKIISPIIDKIRYRIMSNLGLAN
jgi:hypothetical protein